MLGKIEDTQPRIRELYYPSEFWVDYNWMLYTRMMMRYMGTSFCLKHP